MAAGEEKDVIQSFTNLGISLSFHLALPCIVRIIEATATIVMKTALAG
jgi:hypothetical protein